MRSGTTLRQGDVVIVPFPFSDLSSTKRRPGLVISCDSYNGANEDVVICGITSNLENRDYSVLLAEKDLVSGRIMATSRIKADKLFTLKKSEIIKSVARVSDGILNRVKDEMLKLFSF